jgi:cytochrome c biogenesis protein CcdA
MDFLAAVGRRLSDSPFTALPLVFLAGVLTSFTPCIYPR